ncbi:MULTISPECIES: ATP-binding protein [unclassified Photobacterium]|uniref:ATP-binding protein n=1 Tax=unclassified Photobacterium TaxID=2628852 RepID=UPI001EDD862F|nr:MULTISPECIES: ATP-binding protein [unclassified Photobacterium]MCG3862710.1 ATP-binding protein [Photobacterium sp. Ph6]MCG3874241.1 ATP-binding protein [Photobacterium sp. Ph5]
MNTSVATVDEQIAESIETSHAAIMSEFSKFNFAESMIESIWNSLDANSTEVNLEIELLNEFGNIMRIVVTDNGDGIPYDSIPFTFKKYKDSQKRSYRSPMTKGEKGLGRFAFHKFAHEAKWISKSKFGTCSITMNADNLSVFSRKELTKLDADAFRKGTRVQYERINSDLNKQVFDQQIVPYLQTHLSCYLLVSDQTSIKIDGKKLKPIDHKITPDEYVVGGFDFSARYVTWAKNPKCNSYVYFINKKTQKVIYKASSKLKKAGFYTSAYVESDFFDNFEPTQGQLNLDDNFNLDSPEFIEVLTKSRNALSDSYRSYKLKEVERLIEEYDENEIFPNYRKMGEVDIIAEYKEETLKNTIKILYQAEPSLFGKIKDNKKHMRVFIGLLDRISFSPSENLFSILDGVINLSSKEESDLAGILKDNKLSNITKAISKITKRQEVLDILKSLIDDHTSDSKEKHIQKIIENNLWIFGEQYNLLTAEEPDFEDALKALLEINGNEDYYQKGSVTHKDKNAEMDIFCTRRFKEVDVNGKEYYKCLVIELKRASENIKDIHYNQLMKYFSVIESNRQFTDGNHHWEFLLIAKDMGQDKSTSIVRGNLKQFKGTPGLLFESESNEHRIFCKTWDNIFSGYKIKYKHLLDNLEIQAQNIMNKTPDQLSERAVELGSEIS